MKKLVLVAAVMGLFYSANVSAQTGQDNKQKNMQQDAQKGQEWQKQENNMFRGAGETWYKIEDEQVMRSQDGNTWEKVEGNKFQSQDGKWYRYENGELQMSTDGQNWEDTEVWTDRDGRTYMIDENGNVITRRDKTNVKKG